MVRRIASDHIDRMSLVPNARRRMCDRVDDALQRLHRPRRTTVVPPTPYAPGGYGVLQQSALVEVFQIGRTLRMDTVGFRRRPISSRGRRRGHSR